ncbi:hypothetical protein [Emcibacter sp.]|uniref:hypothetical protein n=1 Tax=Emcibacter sp. TaxID=1979954 RepID=UPI002AA894C2|nr:hypothetical protein [Emcibacter sp.]
MTWINIFEDQFDTETVNVALQEHLPSSGGEGWTDEIRPGGSVYVDWAAERLASPWWSGGEAVYLINTAEAPGDDQTIESSFVTSANALLLRYGDTANGGSGYLATYHAGSTFYQILRLDQGSETVLVSVGPQVGHDSTVVLRLEAVGDSLSLYADGVLKIQVQDSTYSAGQAGIRMKQSSSGFNFIRVQHDVIEGGPELFPQTAFLDLWSDSPGLTSLSLVNPGGCIIAVVDEPLQLTQKQAISPADGMSAMAGMETILAAGVPVSPHEAVHAQSATGLTLLQIQALNPENATQMVTSLVVVLSRPAATSVDRCFQAGIRNRPKIIAGSTRRIAPNSNRMMRL